jgi:hypothetical protein
MLARVTNLLRLKNALIFVRKFPPKLAVMRMLDRKEVSKMAQKMTQKSIIMGRRCK